MAKKNKKRAPKIVMIAQFVPVWVLYYFFRLLPLRVAYWIGEAVAMLFYVLGRRHRTRTISHILYANVADDSAAAAKLARKSYREFGKLLVEIFKADQLLKEDSIRIIGNNSLARRAGAYGDEGREYKNIIIATAHYGNWEIAGNFWARHSHTPMVSLMREFDNPYIGKLILNHRQGQEHELVLKDGGFRAAFKALKQGKSLALLVDQHANRFEGVETIFFGKPCRTHASVALLHLKTQVPIVPEITRRRNNKFQFEFVVGDEINYTPTGDQEKDIQAITQLMTTALEKLIAEAPEQWLWAHRRWLHINR